MSRITREEVERIADLARLELSAAECDRMTADLATMLDYVEELRALDTTGVGPTAQAGRADASLRDDAVVPGLSPGEAVAAAPRAAGTTFIVPKVIEGGEDS